MDLNRFGNRLLSIESGFEPLRKPVAFHRKWIRTASETGRCPSRVDLNRLGSWQLPGQLRFERPRNRLVKKEGGLGPPETGFLVKSDLSTLNAVSGPRGCTCILTYETNPRVYRPANKPTRMNRFAGGLSLFGLRPDIKEVVYGALTKTHF